MSVISNWFAYHTKTHKVVIASPLVGVVPTIAMACQISPTGGRLGERKTAIGAAGVQLLSCGIAGTAAYLLWHHASFAAVFKISTIFGAFVLGGASFFIAPAIILGIYLLCKLVGYLWTCCHPPSVNKHIPPDDESASKHSISTNQPIIPEQLPPDDERNDSIKPLPDYENDDTVALPDDNNGTAMPSENWDQEDALFKELINS